MKIRKIKEGEEAQASKVEAIAFVGSVPEKPEHSGNTWGCFSDDGTLSSVVTDWPFTVYYNGKPVKMGGIGGVASLPESRMLGGVRSLFSEILRGDIENGVVFSALYPFSHTYYRRYGYEVCGGGNIVSFPSEALAKYRHASADIRMVETQEDALRLSPLNEKFAKNFNMSVRRDEFSWGRIMHGDYKNAECYRYVLEKKGEPISYVFFKPKPVDGETQLYISDFAYDGKRGLHSLLGLLYKLSPQYSKITMELPPNFPIDSLIEEPYDIEAASPGFSRWMARLLDVEAGLKGLCCPDGSWKCSIRLRDDFLSFNSGIYQLTHDDGGLEVIKAKAESADISLSIQSLTQLCLGYNTLDMTLLRDDAELFGNYEILNKLFTKRPIYMIDKF